MTELSRESGVPVPTIKYYMREGLVPPGERTSPNQAQYEQSHVRRLKLVRALIDVGGLSVAAARDVLEKMSAGGGNPLYAVGKAQYSTTTLREHVEDDAWHEAMERVNKLIADHGWRVGPTNPARRALADVLATLARLGQDNLFGVLDSYAYRTLVWDIFVERVRASAQGRQPDEARIAAALPKAEMCLQALVALKGDGPYLVGGNLTLADLHAAPMLIYFRMAKEGAARLRRAPALDTWLTALDRRPSIRATRSPLEPPS